MNAGSFIFNGMFSSAECLNSIKSYENAIINLFGSSYVGRKPYKPEEAEKIMFKKLKDEAKIERKFFVKNFEKLDGENINEELKLFAWKLFLV